jgi:hypothetical protein
MRNESTCALQRESVALAQQYGSHYTGERKTARDENPDHRAYLRDYLAGAELQSVFGHAL